MTTDTLSFAQFKTNPGWNAFALQRFGPEPYEAFDQIFAPKDFGRPVWQVGAVAMQMRSAPVDPRGLRGPVTVASVSGRKPANPNRAPDFWSHPSEHVIVSAEGRAFIEEYDSGAHSFFPVDVLHKADGSRFGDKDYFYWVLDRAVSVTLPDQPLAPDGYASAAQHQTAGPVMGRVYRGIAESTEAFAKIRALAFWAPSPIGQIQVRTDLVETANQRGLRGLEMTDFEANRNVVKHTSLIELLPQQPAAQTVKTRKPLWKRWLS